MEGVNKIIFSVVLSAALSGGISAAVSFFTLRTEVAVINTKIENIQHEIQRLYDK